jgi:hypothetical protein
VLLDAPVPLTVKLPVAGAIAQAFERARAGQVPDLAQPFDAHGARSDPALARTRDQLVGAVEQTITRSFRRSFFFSALLAAAAAVLSAATRREPPT